MTCPCHFHLGCLTPEHCNEMKLTTLFSQKQLENFFDMDDPFVLDILSKDILQINMGDIYELAEKSTSLNALEVSKAIIIRHLQYQRENQVVETLKFQPSNIQKIVKELRKRL